MVNIFDYLEYREYLRDFYNDRKKENPWFSYRFISKKISIDPSHLVKIFHLKRHVSQKLVDRFVELCKLNKKEADYFENLVKFNKAKTDRESKKYFEMLLTIKDVKKHTLHKNQYEYFSKWYHSAIFTLLRFYPFDGNYEKLGKRLSPAISVKEAKQSIELLEKLGLIEVDGEGKVNLTKNLVTTGETTRALMIKSYQEETMKLAVDSLYNHPKEKRNVSTITLTLSKKDLNEINEMVGMFRNQLLRFAEKTNNPDSVYQLNIQLFPMTEDNNGRLK